MKLIIVRPSTLLRQRGDRTVFRLADRVETSAAQSRLAQLVDDVREQGLYEGD